MPTEWMAALVTLALGSLAGALGAWLMGRSGPVEGQADSAADLDEQLSHCIAQLRDLEEQKERLTHTAYHLQKADFEGRAAALLRQREHLAASTRGKKTSRDADKGREQVSPTMQFFAERPQLRGALWGGGIVAVTALLWNLVVAEEHARPEPPMAAAANAEREEMQALMVKIRDNPDDVANLTRMAHLLLKNQMLDEARMVNDRAMQRDPNNLEARVHQAVLRAAGGDGDGGMQALSAIVTTDPKFAEAWFFRGMLAMQAGKQDVMKESFKQFVAVAPEGPQRERIKAMLQAQGGASP